MGNPPIGNNFWEGPLGVVLLEFDGVKLGKTTEDTSIEFIEDIKDILYQQDGTQPYDKIPTGQAWQVTAKFGEIKTALIAKLYRGMTIGGNSLLAGRDLYRSGRDNFTKPLIITRVDSDGVESTDPLFILNIFKAMPLPTGQIAYGADTQRDVEIVFYCFYDTTHNAFFYSGHASSVGI